MPFPPMGGLGAMPGMMGGLGGMGDDGMQFDPNMMANLMNNPMIQNMLTDPNIIQQFLSENPFMS